MKKIALKAVNELAWFSAFVLSVKYVPWEVFLFVIAIGVITWFLQEVD